MTDTGPTAAMRAAILRRSGGVCERCHARGGVDVHHRRARGAGGSTAPCINGPANLVHLCRPCHEWVEANFTDAYKAGWKLSLHADPADANRCALVDVDGTHWRLDDHGWKWRRHELGEGPASPAWF